jgi:hypothetical protein
MRKLNVLVWLLEISKLEDISSIENTSNLHIDNQPHNFFSFHVFYCTVDEKTSQRTNLTSHKSVTKTKDVCLKTTQLTN